MRIKYRIGVMPGPWPGGADGARFTARLVQLFSDPMRLLMES